MANFRKPPAWDVKYRNRSDNKKRLRQANDDKLNEGFGLKGTVYFSDYWETRKYLMSDRKLRRALQSHARQIHRRVESQIPRGEGTGGHHMEDVMKIRYIKRGGTYADRQAYHIYVTATGDPSSPGDSFLSAERASQFSKEAWNERMGIKAKIRKETKNGASEATINELKKGLYAVKPNRTGWIEGGLKSSSVSREASKPKRATKRQRIRGENT